MLAKVKMCGSKCLEIVNDGITPGRPDFNTEEELFKFLRLEYLAPQEREMWSCDDVADLGSLSHNYLFDGKGAKDFNKT